MKTAGNTVPITDPPITPEEVGRDLEELDAPVVAVVRDKVLRRFYDPAVSTLLDGDQVVVVQGADRT